MKAGFVTTIRVNPRDCQGVLDVMERVGIDTTGQSFAQLVSLTLSSLLETARTGGLIPEPDSFSYLPRMTPFQNGKNSKKKAAIAKVTSTAGAESRMPGLSKPRPEVRDFVESAVPAATAPQGAGTAQGGRSPEYRQVRPQHSEEEIERATATLTKLLEKEDAEIELTPAERILYDECYQIVYPEG